MLEINLLSALYSCEYNADNNRNTKQHCMYYKVNKEELIL